MLAYGIFLIIIGAFGLFEAVILDNVIPGLRLLSFCLSLVLIFCGSYVTYDMGKKFLRKTRVLLGGKRLNGRIVGHRYGEAVRDKGDKSFVDIVIEYTDPSSQAVKTIVLATDQRSQSKYPVGSTLSFSILGGDAVVVPHSVDYKV